MGGGVIGGTCTHIEVFGHIQANMSQISRNLNMSQISRNLRFLLQCQNKKLQGPEGT